MIWLRNRGAFIIAVLARSSFRSSIQLILWTLHAASEIFFINHWVGGVVVLLVAFVYPTMGLAGLLSVGLALAVHRLSGKSVTRSDSPIVYNTLLVGFSVGSAYGLTVPTLFLLATGSLLTYVLCWWVGDRFASQGLPILSIPFVVTTSLLYLAAPRFPNLMHGTVYPETLSVLIPNCPLVLNWFLTATGAILFLPSPWVGLLIAVILLIRSPVALGFGFFGFLLGCWLTGLYVGSFELGVVNPNNFNFILLGIGVGGFFIRPSRWSVGAGIVAILIAVLLVGAANSFWAQLGIPVFTLPFIVASLGTIVGMRHLAPQVVTHHFFDTPEFIVDAHCVLGNHRANQVTLTPPVQSAFVTPNLDGTTTWQSDPGNWVAAPHSGRVIWLSTGPSGLPAQMLSELGWISEVMMIDAGNGVVTIGGLDIQGVTLTVGDWVTNGQSIGRVGGSGGVMIGLLAAPFLRAGRRVPKWRYGSGNIGVWQVIDKPQTVNQQPETHTLVMPFWLNANWQVHGAGKPSEWTTQVGCDGALQVIGFGESVGFNLGPSGAYGVYSYCSNRILRSLALTLWVVPAQWTNGMTWSTQVPLQLVVARPVFWLLGAFQCLVPKWIHARLESTLAIERDLITYQTRVLVARKLIQTIRLQWRSGQSNWVLTIDGTKYEFTKRDDG